MYKSMKKKDIYIIEDIKSFVLYDLEKLSEMTWKTWKLPDI